MSMAHAGLWGIGAYTAAIAVERWHVDFLQACLLAIIVAGLAGAVVALPALRARSHYFLIVTFILTLLVVVAGNNLGSLTGGPLGKVLIAHPVVFGVDMREPRSMFALYFVLYVISLLAYYGFGATKFGRSLVMIRENEDLARALGVDTRLLKFGAFAVSGLFAGLGGAMLAYYLRYLVPDLFGLSGAVLIPLILLIGGSRSGIGPLLGAFTVQFLPLFLGFSPNVSFGVNGALLIVIILLASDGIAGWFGRVGKRLLERGAGLELVAKEAAAP
jgi:branched-chain amino acid transport system permease protein